MADIITRLKVESSDYDNKLKRATSELTRMASEAQKAGNKLNVTDKANIQFAQSLGTMQTQAKTAKGRISELTNSFTEVSLIYKRLTDEEKRSPFGKALSQSLDQLKGRINNAKTDLADVQKQLGSGIGNLKSGGLSDFKSILGDVGGQLGVNSNLLSMVTSGTIGYTAAIGGAVVAVGAAAKAWADYNSELAKQDQISIVTTGLNGADAEKLTNYARSLADVFDVDFREAVNGVNTLMNQFGVSAEEAMDIMSKGMKGMIQGDGPKLLQMIQQYAPAYRDAGISASELVAIIHNTEGGIFTDQNMQAITMGIKNIRMMKDSTKDALKSIGVDADDIIKKLNDGSMSVFDALKVVSDAIQNVDSGSKAAGEVMNDVFGRQGVTAGTNLGKAIATLNTNLEETSKQTGSVGDKMYELQKADEALQSSLRQLFGLSSEGWENMKIEIETYAINTLTSVIDKVNELSNAFDELPAVAQAAISSLATTVTSLIPVVGSLVSMLTNAWALQRNLGSGGGSGPGTTGANVGGYVGDILKNNQSTYTSKDGKFTSADKSAVDAYDTQMANIKKWSNVSNGSKGGKSSGSKSDPLGDSIARAQRGFNSSLSEDVIAKMTIIPELKGGDTDILKEITKNGENKLSAVESLFGISSSDGKKTFSKDDFDKEKWHKSQGKDTKKEEKTFDTIMQNSEQFVGGLSNIGQGLAGLGVDLGEGFNETVAVMQSILSVVTGIQAIVAVIETLTGVDAIPFLHTGGIVPQYAATGKLFARGTDTIPAMLSPGELVLNRSQQGNLASQLNGNAFSNLHLETTIREDKLVVMLNNGLRKRGYGTLVTSRR